MKTILTATLSIAIFLSVNGRLAAQDVSVSEKTTPACCAKGATACTHDHNMSKVCQKSCAVIDYDPKDLKSQAEAKIGDLTTCPVSGVVFKVTNTSHTVKHEENEFYTCCSACASIFNRDPKKYTSILK